MIPRQVDLVPEIGVPPHIRQQQEHAAQQRVLRQVKPSYKTYPIMMSAQLEAAVSASSPVHRRTGIIPEISADKGVRLYSLSARAPDALRAIPPAQRFALQEAEEDDNEETVEDNNLVNAQPGVSTKGKQSRKRRRQLDEPGRLTYTTVQDGQTKRMSSVASPQYGHLVCVPLSLLALSAGGDMAAVGQPLDRPLMELQPERTSILVDPKLWDGKNVPSYASRQDFPSMDKADTAGGGSRWDMETADEDPADKTDGRKKGRKEKEKVKGLSNVMEARKAGEALSQRRSLFGAPQPVVFANPPADPPLKKLCDEAPRVQSSTSATTTTTTTTAAATTTMHAPTASTVSLASSIAEQGVRVVEQLRGEGRRAHLFKELEKLILKQLPMYASVAVKAKNPATNGEAKQWFKLAQQELKHWIVSQGYTIDPSGMITF